MSCAVGTVIIVNGALETTTMTYKLNIVNLS